MAKKSPWHSDESDVFHNNFECNTGNNIERENLCSGTGGKSPLSRVQAPPLAREPSESADAPRD